MSADTYKAKLAIEVLRKYLDDCKQPSAQGDHPSASPEAVLDLIETYEWLLERREHLALDHDALKLEHETMTDWKSEQVGALMIAATQAIDAAESMWRDVNSGEREPAFADEIAKWRSAVSRTNPAPIGVGDGTP